MAHETIVPYHDYLLLLSVLDTKDDPQAEQNSE